MKPVVKEVKNKDRNMRWVLFDEHGNRLWTEDCRHENKTVVHETNSFPYGNNITYERCIYCGSCFDIK